MCWSKELVQQTMKENTLLGKFLWHRHLLCTGMKSGSCISYGCGFLLSETPLAFSDECRSSTTEELLSKEQMVTAHSLQVTVQKEHQSCSNAFFQAVSHTQAHTSPKNIFGFRYPWPTCSFIILNLHIFKKHCPFQAIWINHSLLRMVQHDQ